MIACARVLIFLLACSFSSRALATGLPYAIVDTAQDKCFDTRGQIAPPAPGEPFHGQDAQHRGHAPGYALSADGLTVVDKVTGLTWQRSPDTDGDAALTSRDKLSFGQAGKLPAKLNAARLGGFADWRLPTLKELYSLFDARGIDPSGPTDPDAERLTPFIDTTFFKFAYGDARAGERVIDSQYVSSTRYVGQGPRGVDKVFGVNFADGRIKGYDLRMPLRGGPGGEAGAGGEKTFFVLCVRGNPRYGLNDFRDNHDGTITDRATGLMWSKTDSGLGMNWRDALAWVQQKNGERFLGHDGWRLPDVKELQSIVDYSRAPDATNSAAIDPIFECTGITSEAGQADWPFYWSATTHIGLRGGSDAMYVAFGRAAGWMSAPGPARQGGAGRLVDIHGAGAQRSDPKTGDPERFSRGRGPQGDVVRISNYVRLVRTTKE